MNTWTIARKELSSYFRSPIAYGVMCFFALITGFFFYSAVRFFLAQSLQATMMGQAVPLNVNEWVVRNVLSNMSVVGLFIILIWRLFAFCCAVASGSSGSDPRGDSSRDPTGRLSPSRRDRWPAPAETGSPQPSPPSAAAR